MEWKTRVTELLGCKYPILEGAFGGVGTWEFAAAVSKTGAHGCITAAVYKTPERLREAIKRYRDATDEPFSVNLSVTFCPHIDEMLDVIIDEGCPVLETAVYNGDKWGERAKEAGLKWIHKSAIVKHALHAEQHGADAVILVGLEGIGFKNINQLPTLTTIVWAARQIKVPIIAAGGLGDARGFAACLAMGADGIMMGTRFMATKECPISDRAKQEYIDCQPDFPPLRHRVLAPPDPQAYEEIMKLRNELPIGVWTRRLEEVMVKSSDWKKYGEAWTMSADEIISRAKGHRGSMAVSVIDDIPPCKELIDRITQGAEEILASWQFLKTR